MINKENNDKEDIVFFVYYNGSKDRIPICSKDLGKTWYTKDGEPVDISKVKMISQGCFQMIFNSVLLVTDIVLIVYLLLT